MQEGERLWRGEMGDGEIPGGLEERRCSDGGLGEVWEGGSSFLPPFPAELPKERAHGLPWHSRKISSGSSHFLCLGMSPTNKLSSWERGMERGCYLLISELGVSPGPCPPHPKGAFAEYINLWM